MVIIDEILANMMVFGIYLTWDGMVQIIRLARKLPTGEVSALKSDAVGEQEEALDENDLT